MQAVQGLDFASMISDLASQEPQGEREAPAPVKSSQGGAPSARYLAAHGINMVRAGIVRTAVQCLRKR